MASAYEGGGSKLHPRPHRAEWNLGVRGSLGRDDEVRRNITAGRLRRAFAVLKHALRPDFLGESAPRAAQTRVSDGPARADVHLERGASTSLAEIETIRGNDVGRTRRGELGAHVA